jgi:hypothetical protein
VSARLWIDSENSDHDQDIKNHINFSIQTVQFQIIADITAIVQWACFQELGIIILK